MSAQQLACPIRRGVHLEYVAPGRWTLTGDANVVTVRRGTDDRWLVEIDGRGIGNYNPALANVALAHAYSIASDPVKQ